MSKCIFNQEIAQDWTVCNNCFSRVRIEVDDWYSENLPKSVKDSLGSMTYDTPDGEVVFVASERRTNDVAVACLNCGVIDSAPKDEDELNRPLDTKTIINFARRVSKRLDENGVEHDEEILVAHTRNAKTNPDKQFADDRILKEAVNAAVPTNEEDE